MNKNRSKCRIVKIDRMDQKELNIIEDQVPSISIIAETSSVFFLLARVFLR